MFPFVGPTTTHDPDNVFETGIRRAANAVGVGASDEDVNEALQTNGVQADTAYLLIQAAHLLIHYRELDP